MNDFYEKLKAGQTNFSGSDFQNKSFDNADIDGNNLLLTSINFGGCSFYNAKFKSTNFSGSIFSNADLSNVTFDRCILIGADFHRANLKGAKFIWGTLEDSFLGTTNLEDVIFIGTSLENSTFGFTKFKRTGLGMIRDLDKVKLSPLPDDAPLEIRANFKGGHITCDIDWETIKLTAQMHALHLSENTKDLPQDVRNEIERVITSPKVFSDFLEKNNTESYFIEAYWKMIKENKKDYESVFISYSTQNQNFADFIYDRLGNSGINAWYAPKEMAGGKTIIDQIRKAISQQDRLLLILSHESISSNWVANEIRQAYKREKQGKKRVLFPISIINYKELLDWELFDSDIGIDLAHHIRSYYIPDFSKWEEETNSDIEIRKLIDALKKIVDK